MNRLKMLATLAGVLAILSVGPGCGMFDGFCGDDCDCDNHSTSYQRDGLPTPRDAGPRQTSESLPSSTTPAQPGTYTTEPAPTKR